VVGHSLGGLIALHLAAKNPSLISRLILFGPVKAPAQAGRDGCRARAEIVRLGGMVACTDSVINNALAATTKTSRPEVVGFARELLTRQDAEGYALACLALGAAENPVWADIAADVTVVSGGQDKVSNPETCKSIVDSIKKGNLVTWEECGHWHTLESALDSADIVKRSML
jgi:3-oxoadipate enol-lactonase